MAAVSSPHSLAIIWRLDKTEKNYEHRLAMPINAIFLPKQGQGEMVEGLGYTRMRRIE